MSSLRPRKQAIQETGQAIKNLSKEERYTLLLDLLRDDTLLKDLGPNRAYCELRVPMFARLKLGSGINPQDQIMILVIVGLIIALIVALSAYIFYFNSPGANQLLPVITTIIGYLAGVLTPKPTKSKSSRQGHNRES